MNLIPTHSSNGAQTRRQMMQRIAAPLVPLYGEHEARQIALLVVAELGGCAPAAVLADGAAAAGFAWPQRIVKELTAGRPLQYVLGYTEFCGLRLGVQEGVLIPRPETEELVEWIVSSSGNARRILDVGTGSGCIALALKARLPHAEVCAADLSEEALAIARRNASTLKLDITFGRADALAYETTEADTPSSPGAPTAHIPPTSAAALDTKFGYGFDLIVSNPPYIPLPERAEMRRNVTDWEPDTALFVPEEDPLLFYRAIARCARRMLASHGRLFFEVHERYAAETCALLRTEGYVDVTLRNDFNDKPRMLCGQKAE